VSTAGPFAADHDAREVAHEDRGEHGRHEPDGRGGAARREDHRGAHDGEREGALRDGEQPERGPALVEGGAIGDAEDPLREPGEHGEHGAEGQGAEAHRAAHEALGGAGVVVEGRAGDHGEDHEGHRDEELVGQEREVLHGLVAPREGVDGLGGDPRGAREHGLEHQQVALEHEVQRELIEQHGHEEAAVLPGEREEGALVLARGGVAAGAEVAEVQRERADEDEPAGDGEAGDGSRDADHRREGR
jgi:hypothetical protein